jgi:hypothetical protein
MKITERSPSSIISQTYPMHPLNLNVNINISREGSMPAGRIARNA